MAKSKTPADKRQDATLESLVERLAALEETVGALVARAPGASQEGLLNVAKDVDEIARDMGRLKDTADAGSPEGLAEINRRVSALWANRTFC